MQHEISHLWRLESKSPKVLALTEIKQIDVSPKVLKVCVFPGEKIPQSGLLSMKVSPYSSPLSTTIALTEIDHEWCQFEPHD